MKHLNQIAEIRSGHPFRGKLESSPKGNVSVLQLKDVTDSFTIDSQNASRIQLGAVKERYLVAPGDIVFRSRGQTNTCALVKELGGTTVVAAPLFLIRATSDAVLPEYLCWYINQSAAQSYFNRNARGTAGRMIGRDTLEKLKIHLPPLEVQQNIVELAELASREQVLMAELAKKKKYIVSQILMNRAKTQGATP